MLEEFGTGTLVKCILCRRLIPIGQSTKGNKTKRFYCKDGSSDSECFKLLQKRMEISEEKQNARRFWNKHT